MPERPNILFLLNDHQLHYRHGWDAGARPARPHFDRLASQGVSFRRAYTPCPLCMPARRSILTAVSPHNHRLLKNDERQEPAAYDLYLDILAEAGYSSYYFGKWHAGPGTALDHRCRGFSHTSYGNPYTTAEYRRYLQERHLQPAEHFVERSFWPDRVPTSQYYRCQASWCNEHAVGLTVTPKETHEAFFLAHLAREKLREIARAREMPFSMRVDFWGPHQPHFPTPEFAALYSPADIPEYASFHDDLSDKPEAYWNERNYPLNDNGRLILPSVLPWSEWQKVLARCYAHISMVDAAGGWILDALDELGLAEDTLVVWTSDHGDALASHGGHFDKGSYMIEEVCRIPMAIRWPRRIPPSLSSESLVSLLDVAPTILEAAGAGFATEVEGMSLLRLFDGGGSGWRDDLACETHGHPKTEIGRMIVSGQLKYVAWQGQTHELYDLGADPYEMKNLIAEPGWKPELAEVQRRLRDWQRRTHDPERVIGWGLPGGSSR